MDSNGETPPKKAMPPYGSALWYANFFSTYERIKIDKVDAQFIKSYGITPNGVEYKVINGLKYLGLIDEDGVSTEKMRSLAVVGEPFQKNLESIIKNAYQDLFAKIKDFQQALSDDLINYFRSEYNTSPRMANESAKVFVYLAQKAKTALSSNIIDSLGTIDTARASSKSPKKGGKKLPAGHNEKRGTKTRSRQGERANDERIATPSDMIRMEYQGKFLLFLPRGNKQIRQTAAKLAKQFIETYELEEDNEAV